MNLKIVIARVSQYPKQSQRLGLPRRLRAPRNDGKQNKWQMK